MTSKIKLGLIYLCGFLLTTHYASIVYLNSSLLKESFGDNAVNILYIFGSLGSIATLMLAPSLFRNLGSKVTFLLFIVIEVFAVFGLGNSALALIIPFLFIVHQAAESILYFGLDVSLEEQTKNEGTTGSKRGVFFTVQNIAWVFSPLALTFLISYEDFSKVYFLSGIALIVMSFIIALSFENHKLADTKNSHISFIFNSLRHGGDKMRIVVSQFILNFFYAWMVIYLPLLLNKEIGFEWGKIGLILSIMLIPFLIFQLPAGFLADKKFGEKEMLAIGFILMAIFTFTIPILKTQSFLLWAMVLFGTRIGASLVEIASEVYFFKHVKATDTGIISVFRMSRPLSYVIVPILSIPVISYFSYSSSFTFLAIITTLGLFFLPKKDTR